MHVGNVAVATISLVRSPAEEKLLRQSLETLATVALPIAIADAGASQTFTNFLAGLRDCSVTVPDEGGLVNQVKASFELASRAGTKFILYTEPDKGLFFADGLQHFLRVAVERIDAGVVLAARSADSFRTFPAMQQYTETVINHLCGDAIGTRGDYSYGPFLMNRALLPSVAQVDARVGWGWRHFIFRTAHRRGYRVEHIEGDFYCAPEQRTEDELERRHRVRQLSQNLAGLID